MADIAHPAAVAHEIAWDHQVQRRQLLHVAEELDQIAATLPPERTPA